jgi:mRNA interferase RelE/StbE
MAYKVLFTDKSKKQFAKLPQEIKTRIIKYLENKVEPNPFNHGKALSGDKKGLWRYRIGDYRVICFIDKAETIVLTLEIGHRKEVYN